MEIRDLVVLGICMCCILACILAAGCITAAKELMRGTQPAPVPEPTPEVTATPTPDVSQPVVYIEPIELQNFRLGRKELGQFFTWHRENVSGKKDMTVKVTVYDYKVLTRYKWWSDSNGRYYWQFPGAGKKFVIIFAYLEMVGEDDSQDPRYYVGDGWRRFWLQVGNDTIAPDTYYQKGVRIKELEETFTLNGHERVRPFGYNWEWVSESTCVKNETEEGNCIPAGWQAISPLYLRMGKSNAWDGYIIFSNVSMDTRIEDIKVLSQWDAFGNPWWQLS